MAHEFLNVRLPRFTALQIDRLCEHLGVTKTQLVVLAIDRMMRELDQGALSSDADPETDDQGEDAGAPPQGT